MFGLYNLLWVLTWFIGSAPGRLIVLLFLLWWLDSRYFGIVSTLIFAPLRRERHIARLREQVRINTADIPALIELGDHYLHAGKPRSAADYLEQAVALGEDGARTLYLLGAARVRLGRPEEGQAMLTDAIAKSPEMAYGEPYLYLMEAAFARDGKDSPRIDELVAALEPFDSVEVLTRAGLICKANGRKDLGQRLLRDALTNYGYTPAKLRRRSRYWMMQARLNLLLMG
ncbi:MAG: tetratricopeptide repeat protein [Chloroflexota bacterium]